MADRPDRSLTPVQQFFASLIARDASGRSWLAALLAQAPHGKKRLGDILDSPGSLLTPLVVPGVGGRLGCFEYPVLPPRELLLWFIDHPDQLNWPPTIHLSRETVRLRRALLYDDPPGAQAKAQERARELIATRSSWSREWWRFEDPTRLECVLMTDRLALTVEGERTEPWAPATDWYPIRSRLVHNLEAARQLADGLFGAR